MSVILRNNKTPKSQNPNCCLPSILVSVLWKSKRYALIVVLGILVGQRVGNGSGFGYVRGNNLVVDLNLSPYAIGPPDPRFEVGAVYETSKEVSSMPKVQPLSSGGQVVGRSAASLGYRNEDQGVEVWAVHRKGSSSACGIFMEYEIVHTCSLDETELHNCLQERESIGLLDRGPICQHTHVPLFISCSSYLYKCHKEEKYSILNRLRVFHLERPGLGLKEIAQEYNLNWDSSNTEAGSSILNLEFF